MAEINLGTLYDFNKQAMKQLKPLDPVEFSTSIDFLAADLYRLATREKNYWMLLNNERRDFTVFKVLSAEGFAKEFRETLMNRGQIISIDKQEDGNYEIWVRDIDSQENFVYYLFDYSFGVIEA